MSLFRDVTATIVMDLGSSLIRLGFAGELHPRSTIPASIHLPEGWTDDGDGFPMKSVTVNLAEVGLDDNDTMLEAKCHAAARILAAQLRVMCDLAAQKRNTSDLLTEPKNTSASAARSSRRALVLVERMTIPVMGKMILMQHLLSGSGLGVCDGLEVLTSPIAAALALEPLSLPNGFLHVDVGENDVTVCPVRGGGLADVKALRLATVGSMRTIVENTRAALEETGEGMFREHGETWYALKTIPVARELCMEVISRMIWCDAENGEEPQGPFEVAVRPGILCEGKLLTKVRIPWSVLAQLQREILCSGAADGITISEAAAESLKAAGKGSCGQLIQTIVFSGGVSQLPGFRNACMAQIEAKVVAKFGDIGKSLQVFDSLPCAPATLSWFGASVYGTCLGIEDCAISRADYCKSLIPQKAHGAQNIGEREAALTTVKGRCDWAYFRSQHIPSSTLNASYSGF
eukprot:Clim_evm67s146 gene=Clim_evmTU67s146